MTGDEVRYWFEQAAGVPAEDRASFLNAHCPDPEVREEVLSLLEHDTVEPGYPPAAIRDAIESMLGNDGSGAPAHRVGAFELGRLLGSGGMGFVYEGQRIDGEVRQRVAVKFAQVSPAASEKHRESAHHRFNRERQVLASLRHPYIAGLIDAGTTRDGVPYAVIEQVDGIPIDSYSDEHLKDPADRIRLVLKLCDAVQFAHRNLIVHSDIKPDNVLVTPDGIPKLIDFGIAHNLSEEATQTTLRAFTPGYASPEQFVGLPATVATDVYGIGAVLYRLLTGAKPRDLTGMSSREPVRNFWEEEVQRPSVIRPELKGDLENILLKALQRDPQRRYGSVPELADDLNRYLARRPVRATPDSLIYRTGRFVRRNWPVVAALAAVAAALTVATAVSVREKQMAIQRAAETRRMAERLMFEVDDEIRGVLGATRARERLGTLTVQYLEELERDQGRDPELAWELFNAYARLGLSRGAVSSSVGDSLSGAQLARKTLVLGTAVEAASPPGERLDRLFTVYEELIPILLESGRAEEQREAIDRLIRLAPRLAPVREAQALKQLARYYDVNGARVEAAETWRRALAVLRRLSEGEAGEQLASTLVGYGRAQALAGEFAGAADSLREAIRIAEGKLAASPQKARAARQLYWSRVALGDVFGGPGRFSLGRVAQAAEQYRQAQRIAERLVAGDPGNEMARLDLARAMAREGVAVAAIEPARALALLERSHEIATGTSTQSRAALQSRLEYLTSSVEPLTRLGQAEKARAFVAEARRLARRMRQQGIAVDERDLLRAEAIHQDAAGRRREALETSRRHLELLEEEKRAVLSESFGMVELLTRMRRYSAGLDPAACAAASARLAGVWEELRSAYPESGFVRAQADRAKTADAAGCARAAGAPPSARQISGRAIR